jgi:hypothetical protein
MEDLCNRGTSSEDNGSTLQKSSGLRSCVAIKRQRRRSYGRGCDVISWKAGIFDANR